MDDAGVRPEQADNVVAGCALVVAALARLGTSAWTLLELAATVERERRPGALAEARQQARLVGCAAMLDHALNACRRLVRSAEGIADHPDLDALLDAVDGCVAASILAGRIDPELGDVLGAPLRALTSLLAVAAPQHGRALIPAQP
jgi:hypothetical protein